MFDHEEALASLSLAVRNARLAYGWTVSELALRSGVGESTIKRFERTGIITSDRLLLVLMPLGLLGGVLASVASRQHWTLEQHERLARKHSRGDRFAKP